MRQTMMMKRMAKSDLRRMGERVFCCGPVSLGLIDSWTWGCVVFETYQSIRKTSGRGTLEVQQTKKGCICNAGSDLRLAARGILSRRTWSRPCVHPWFA